MILGFVMSVIIHYSPSTLLTTLKQSEIPIPLPYDSKCNVCNTKVGKCNIHCSNCKHYIHKKCSQLKPYEINKIDLNKWECSTCLKEKFPFVLTSLEEIKWMNFNSNSDLNCCSNSSPSDLNILLNSLTDDNTNSEFSDPDNIIKNNFKYYDIHQFHKMKLNDNDNKFSIIHTNIDGIDNNIGDLENLLTDLNHDFDIISLTETHNPENKKHLFTAPILDGYEKFIDTTGTTSKSGARLYVHEHLKPIPRPDLNFKHFEQDKEEFETLWIEVTSENNPNVIIASIYRHPTPTNEKFLHSLEKALTKLKKEKNKLIVLTGDFNQNLLKYGNDSGTTNFLNLLTENNYQVNITGPTRMVDSSKPSLLDNIFTLNITDQISGIFLDKISYDHLPNFISFNLRNPSKKNVHIKTRDTSNFDENKFQEDLAQLDLFEHTHLNTNDLTLTFHYHFMKVYNTHASIKVLSRKAAKTKQKPWLTPGILKSIRNKRTLLTKYNAKKDPQILTQLKIYRHQLKKIIKISRREYYKKYFIDNANNIKKTWKQINIILHRKKSSQKNIQLSINGSLTSDEKTVANAFNKYFTNVGNDLSK